MFSVWFEFFSPILVHIPVLFDVCMISVLKASGKPFMLHLGLSPSNQRMQIKMKQVKSIQYLFIYFNVFSQ